VGLAGYGSNYLVLAYISKPHPVFIAIAVKQGYLVAGAHAEYTTYLMGNVPVQTNSFRG
jgi:hypothetical protein